MLRNLTSNRSWWANRLNADVSIQREEAFIREEARLESGTMDESLWNAVRGTVTSRKSSGNATSRKRSRKTTSRKRSGETA